MRFKYLDGFEANAYQTPSTQIISFLVEQPVLTASNPVFSGNGPEGYDIDKDEFNW